MPLTEFIEFKTLLQRGNRIQIPRRVRWQFKLEPDQVLKVEVSPVGGFVERWESFYGQMNKDGRVTIPLLVRQLVVSRLSTRPTLEGIVLHVRIRPT